MEATLKRSFRFSKTIFFLVCMIVCVMLSGCETREPASADVIQAGFSALNDVQLDVTIQNLEALEEDPELTNMHGLWVDPVQALAIADEIMESRRIEPDEVPEVEVTPQVSEEYVRSSSEETSPEVPEEGDGSSNEQASPEPDSSPHPVDLPIDCPYATAAELVASCPTAYEIQKIRSDFNIVFDEGLITNDIQAPWNCQDTGDDSSIMLTMYNSFRLLMCVPLDQPLPWAPEHDNLYEWMQSLDLVEIKYYLASEGQNSHAWPGHVAIKGNNMADPIYRDVVNPQSGVGVIYSAVLLVHEARHAGDNILHDCGYKDSNLEFMGAWAVQYYLLNMLAEHSGDYFTAYEMEQFAWEAESLLETRFCELE
jgi:hypothetical protein